MDPLSVLSLLIAAIGHDIYHPGCDNMTLAKERVDIKRRYNGQSLAEMLSCEVVLELLRRSGALCGDGEDDVSGLTTSQIAYIEDVIDERVSEHGFIKARGKSEQSSSSHRRSDRAQIRRLGALCSSERNTLKVGSCGCGRAETRYKTRGSK